MSAKVMGQVFDHVSSAPEQAVLLALADHAEHDGSNAYPSVDLLAWKTGMTERGVQKILARLRGLGVLVEEREPGYHRPRTYRIVLAVLERKPTFVRKGERRSPMKDEPGSPMKGERGDAKGEPDGTQRVNGEVEKGEPARSPEPSLLVLDPSENLSRATRAPAVEIPTGPLTPAQIKREQHRFGKEAERVWTETAAKVGSPYTDRSALRIVHEQAIDATRWARETQVLAAIRRRMDAKSSGRRIPEWVRLEAADEEQREHVARLRRDPIDEVIEPARGGQLRHIAGAVAKIAGGIAS